MKNNSKNSLSPLLHLTYVLQHLSDKNLLPAVGVGLGQVRIMSVLDGYTTSSQNRIAQALQQTEANVSRQLKEMKAKRLVSVTKNKKDARVSDVRLTAKGAKYYKQALKVLAAQEKQMLKLLDKKSHTAFDKAMNDLMRAMNIFTNRLL